MTAKSVGIVSNHKNTGECANLGKAILGAPSSSINLPCHVLLDPFPFIGIKLRNECGKTKPKEESGVEMWGLAGAPNVLACPFLDVCLLQGLWDHPGPFFSHFYSFGRFRSSSCQGVESIVCSHICKIPPQVRIHRRICTWCCQCQYRCQSFGVRDVHQTCQPFSPLRDHRGMTR